MCVPLFVGFSVWFLVWYALLCVLSSFVSILTRKRDLVALLLIVFLMHWVDIVDPGRSLMKTKKSIDPTTVPCGTLGVTWAVSDVAPSSTTSCCLLLRNDLTHFSVLPLVP